MAAFRLSSDVSDIGLVFGSPLDRPTPNFPPSWNVASTDSLPSCATTPKPRSAASTCCPGGLIPYWGKDIRVGFVNIIGLSAWRSNAAAVC